MNENNSRDLRLNISKDGIKARDLIDKKKYLGLDKTKLERLELFIFAMAKGLLVGSVLPIMSNKVSLVREVSINNEYESLLYSLYIGSKGDKVIIENGLDKAEVFELAEEYANSGFNAIEHMMEHLPSEEALWSEFKELDKYFEMNMRRD